MRRVLAIALTGAVIMGTVFFAIAISVHAATFLFPIGGGTGTSTPPTFGQILVGNANGTYTLTATSSLGIISGSTYTGTYPVQVSGSVISLAFGTTTSNTWAGTQTFTNSPVFSTLGAGTVNSTAAGTIYNTATSTVATGLGLSYSGTMGSEIGGVSGTLSVATSSLYTGTTGQFPYFSGTNTITATSTLFLDTTGKIGVGTTTPFAKFSVTGDVLVDSQGTNAFSVGYLGTTTKAFQIDNSASNAGNGLSLTTTAAGSGVTLQTLSANANEALAIRSKGTGSLTVGVPGVGTVLYSINGSTRATLANSSMTFTPAARANTSTMAFTFTAAADTGLNSGVEVDDVLFGLARTKTHQNGAIALERNFLITAPTEAFTTFSGINNFTDLATFGISGAPITAITSNGTTTNAHTIYLGASALNASTTNSYGLTVNANTGAVNNYAAEFLGGNVGIGTSSPWRLLSVGTGNVGTFAISTSTAGCAQFSAFGELYSTGVTCGTGSGGSTGDHWATSTDTISIYPAGATKVGIGTSTPRATLDVINTIATAINTPLFHIASTTAGTATSTFLTVLQSGNVGIGLDNPGALFTVSRQTTVQTPVSGSTGQFVGQDANPLRITFDTHNNSSTSGTALMFRRSRGTSATPLADATDDVLGSLNFRGYGTTAYAAGSTGLISAKATGTFTDTSMPTAITFDTTATTSVTALERVRIDSTGNVGIGSTSPYAKFSIQGQFGDTNRALFAIGSSTSASATSTLFSVLNNGTINTALGAGAVTSSAGGVLSAGTLTVANGGTGTTTGGVLGGIYFWNGTTHTNNAGFYYDGTGNVGIGSTTPWASLSIASSTYNYKNPLFAVATSSDVFGQLLSIFATSSTLIGVTNTDSNNIESGVRVAIGSISQYFFGGILDQLFVNGRINTGDWSSMECSGSASVVTGVSSDAASACGPYQYQTDGASQFQIVSFTSTNGQQSSELFVANSAVNAGGGLFISSSLFARAASTTPVMEAVVSLVDITNTAVGTTTRYVGFTNVNPSGTTFETPPTDGCYFTASSTEANWKAVCSASSVFTVVDTGISTTTQNFTRFRVEMDLSKANFYTQSAGGGMRKLASISTNYPASVSLTGGAYIATAATTRKNNEVLVIAQLRNWWYHSLFK